MDKRHFVRFEFETSSGLHKAPVLHNPIILINADQLLYTLHKILQNLPAIKHILNVEIDGDRGTYQHLIDYFTHDISYDL